jgi:hypothetical protein
VSCRHGKMDGCAACDEIAALRADAERYRWLRDKQAYVGVQRHYQYLPVEQRTGWTIRLITGNDEDMDAAIDAAREAK